MKNYFITIAEMCVDEDLPPLAIVRKIITWHIKPMNKVVLKTGLKVTCCNDKGKRSGYRSYRWEISRLRSGKSEHTFGQGAKGKINFNKKGASDWRCNDFQENKYWFAGSIMVYTNYKRIIIYNHHIHTDYSMKPLKKGELIRNGLTKIWRVKE